jgi:hypothetical protein
LAAPFLGKPHEQLTHLSDCHAVIDSKIPESAFRHAWVGSIFGVLNHGDTAARFYGSQAGSPVVEHAGQHNADNAGTVTHRGGPEQRVNARPIAIFARTLRHKDGTFLE